MKRTWYYVILHPYSNIDYFVYSTKSAMQGWVANHGNQHAIIAVPGCTEREVHYYMKHELNLFNGR